MNIKSAEFVTAIVGDDDLEKLQDLPQIAFIGRSNAGKSSMINLLTQKKNLAKSSATAGLTTEINAYIVNKTFYLIDLPGYGFAKSLKNKQILKGLIEWYLTNPNIQPSLIVQIVDAKVGLTDLDIDTLNLLSGTGKSFIVVANKIDKLKKNDYQKQIAKIKQVVLPVTVVPFSVEKRTGVGELNKIIFDSFK